MTRGVVSQKQSWASDFCSYTLYDVVYGEIPKASIDMFASMGAKYNDSTGYFELNGLTDLSYQEMLSVHYLSSAFVVGCVAPSVATYAYPIARTMYKTYKGRFDMFSAGADGSYMFYASAFEVIEFDANPSFGNFGYMFSVCTKLRKIGGIIRVNRANAYDKTFNLCKALIDVKLQGLTASISFSDSPKLSAESVAFAVNKASDKPVTITLHAEAYARAMADAGVQSALAAKPNVSLASV